MHLLDEIIMNAFIAIAVLAAVSSACGTHHNDDLPAPPVSTEFAGEWSGIARDTMRDGGIADRPMDLSISVDGESLIATGICADGSGAAVAHGIGQQVEWRNTIRCPTHASECHTSEDVYTGGTLVVSDAGELHISASGWRVGCDADGQWHHLTTTMSVPQRLAAKRAIH